MATLGALFGGSWLAMRGGDKKTAQGPPINASSKDEEAFIQYEAMPLTWLDVLLTQS
jgi:F-type H+-transporting ATPase subunit k